MNKPTWFVLIEEWSVRGMGSRGPTLPFLVGAIARISSFQPTSVGKIQGLLQDMANNPVSGHGIRVSWCPTIDAPIFSIVRASQSRKLPAHGSDSGYSMSAEWQPLEFGDDIRSKHGLNCTQIQDCIAKMAEDAFLHVRKGNFSRNRCNSGLYEYGPFTQTEIAFIEAIFRE